MRKISETITTEENEISDVTSSESTQIDKTKKSKKKHNFTFIRNSLMVFLGLTVVTGIVFPVTTTLVAQTLFPYKANGSQITVTLKDGTVKNYGSELVGQSFENPCYLFGRINLGAPSNKNPDSDEYKAEIEKRVKEREKKLEEVGYRDFTKIPSELVTVSGSGVDPHISVDAAKFQIEAIVTARNKCSQLDDGQTSHQETHPEHHTKITSEEVNSIIDKYTEGRFLGLFGEKVVNVLLVNLALDQLI